jgi:hypothetical protein
MGRRDSVLVFEVKGKRIHYAMWASSGFWEQQEDLVRSIAVSRLVLTAWDQYGIRIDPEKVTVTAHQNLFEPAPRESLRAKVKRWILRRPRPVYYPSFAIKASAVTE